jgi:hypothetical protein
MSVSTLLKKLHFKHAANYKLVNGKLKCSRFPEWKGKLALRCNKVYCFTTGNDLKEKIRYVGETVQPTRPFQYHNNKVMKTVRAGLQKIRGKREAKVWILQDFKRIKVKLLGYPFVIGRLGMEGLLVENFSPDWNRKR